MKAARHVLCCWCADGQEIPPDTTRLVRDPCGILMAKADPTGLLRGMTPDQLHLGFDVYLYETRVRKKKASFSSKANNCPKHAVELSKCQKCCLASGQQRGGEMPMSEFVVRIKVSLFGCENWHHFSSCSVVSCCVLPGHRELQGVAGLTQLWDPETLKSPPGWQHSRH